MKKTELGQPTESVCQRYRQCLVKMRRCLKMPLVGFLIEIAFILPWVAGWITMAIFTGYQLESSWDGAPDQIVWLSFVLAFEIVYCIATVVTLMLLDDYYDMGSGKYVYTDEWNQPSKMRVVHMIIYGVSAPTIVLVGMVGNVVVNRVVLWTPFMLLAAGLIVAACVKLARICIARAKKELSRVEE
jgi:hypothetical protein